MRRARWSWWYIADLFCGTTMGAASRDGTAYPSGAPEFTPVLMGLNYSIFSFLCSILYIVVYLIILFIVAIAFSVLWFTASGICKLFLYNDIFMVCFSTPLFKQDNSNKTEEQEISIITKEWQGYVQYMVRFYQKYSDRAVWNKMT